jgi:DNA-binding NtrC family response regulator
LQCLKQLLGLLLHRYGAFCVHFLLQLARRLCQGRHAQLQQRAFDAVGRVVHVVSPLPHSRRLQGLSISLPRLRHRLSDIPELAQHFLETYAIANQLAPLHISPQALQLLQAHSWPGNVRELRAVIELAVVLASGGTIRPADMRLSAPSPKALGATLLDIDQDLTLAEYQKRIVAHMLQKYGGNVLHVAKVLDVGKSTLYRMLKQYPDLRTS